MGEFDDGFDGRCWWNDLSVAIRPMRAATRARLARTHIRAPHDDRDVVEQNAPSKLSKTIHRIIQK